MKNNKFRILTLVIVGVLAQGTSVYAASSTTDGYSKEEMEQRQPGYEWADIDKSNQNVASHINSFSSTKTPEQLAKDSSTSSTTSTKTPTTTATDSNPGNTIVSTTPSTGMKGDYWGKTSNKKWILIEKGVPVSGWKLVSGSWYHMDPDGVMETGWINDGEKWYYLNASGEMAYDTIIDGHYIDSNGVMQ